LVVLKRLNLLYLQKKTRDFVEVMLVTVLLECQSNEQPNEAIAKVFGTVETAPDLTRGLQYFLKKVIRKSDLAGGKKNTKLLKEGCKMAEAVVQAALAKAEDLV
jgi:nucleolar MIF4G domain-containing protein 1